MVDLVEARRLLPFQSRVVRCLGSYLFAAPTLYHHGMDLTTSALEGLWPQGLGRSINQGKGQSMMQRIIVVRVVLVRQVAGHWSSISALAVLADDDTGGGSGATVHSPTKGLLF